jgi:hypothetical protein
MSSAAMQCKQASLLLEHGPASGGRAHKALEDGNILLLQSGQQSARTISLLMFDKCS